MSKECAESCEEKKVDFNQLKSLFEEECKRDVASCEAEVGESLTKYGCALEFLENKVNGQIVGVSIRVVKAPPKQNG